MTQTIVNYAKALYSSNVEKEKIVEFDSIIKENTLIIETFSNPVISNSKKRKAMKRIFDESLWGFVNVLIENKDFNKVLDILKSYKEISTAEENVLKAKVLCVTEPDEPRKKKIIEYVKKKYNTNDVKLKVIIDKSIIGGFIIQVGDFRLDMSIKAKLDKMSRNLQGM